MRLPIHFTHPFDRLCKLSFVGLTLGLAVGVAQLVEPWSTAWFANNDLSANAQSNINVLGSLALISGSAVLVRATIMPSWLSTWLWCRIVHRVPLSVEDAQKVSFLFDGSTGRWLADLALRKLPSSQRLAALRIIANRYATGRGMQPVYPDIAEAERTRQAQQERDEPQSAQEKQQRTTRPDASLALHLGVLDLGSAPREFGVIRAAYRRKIRQYHPDLYANERSEVVRMASEMTTQLNRSYEALQHAYGVSR